VTREREDGKKGVVLTARGKEARLKPEGSSCGKQDEGSGYYGWNCCAKMLRLAVIKL
jgi:hypothetical protein